MNIRPSHIRALKACSILLTAITALITIHASWMARTGEITKQQLNFIIKICVKLFITESLLSTIIKVAEHLEKLGKLARALLNTNTLFKTNNIPLEHHARFNALEASSPNDLRCPISHTLMKNAHYHPECPQANYDFDQLLPSRSLDPTSHELTIKHPHLNRFVPASELKQNKSLNAKTTLYLQLFKEYYEIAVLLPSDVLQKFTTVSLPRLLEAYSYSHSTTGLLSENNLALSEARRQFGLFDLRDVDKLQDCVSSFKPVISNPNTTPLAT